MRARNRPHQLEPQRAELEPLQSNALALGFETLRLGPDMALKRPERGEAGAEEPPSARERRLRIRLGELVSIQAVEDGAGATGVTGRAANMAEPPLQRGAEAGQPQQEPGQR